MYITCINIFIVINIRKSKCQNQKCCQNQKVCQNQKGWQKQSLSKSKRLSKSALHMKCTLLQANKTVKDSILF